MSVILKIRRGTTVQWASSTKVLQVGELGIDTTLNKIKAGNGSSLWTDLPFIESSFNSEGFVTDSELTTAIQSANEYTDTAVSGLGNSLDGQYVLVGDVGNIDGVASLDENGKIPDSEIPDGIARDSELFSGSYDDLSNKPNIALGAVQWTANHYLLPGGENTRYLAGDIVYDGGNIYVANFDNESLPTTNTEYWSLIGSGKRLNIDGRDVPNITYDQLNGKPTIPSLEGYATETYVGTAVSNLVDTAPETLNTLNELAAALGDDPNFATTISTSLGNKLDSSTASSTYAPIANPTFTGTVTIPSGASISGYAPIANPTFTGTVGGITKSMVGLDNVDNTSDANKPVSTATQTALDLKLSLTDPAIDYYITNIGSGSYTVNGVANGPVEFIKGKKYRMHINASGHPFWIQTVSGGYSAGNVYSTGITGNGTQAGHIIVELAQNAPDNLYYACQFHSSMAGAVLVRTDNVSFNAQSSSYTLTTSDSARLVEMSSGGTLTITDSSSFPVGFTCDVLQTGSSQVTIAGNGFTPNATPGLKLRTQWSSATLIKRALNSWVVIGDLSA